MAKTRNGRDPVAPKRNLSAYLLYQNAMRDTFKGENPGMTFGELSKYTSSMYAQLTIVQKASWQERAEDDKQRFLHEMANYVPSPGFDQNGNPIAQYPHVTGSKKKQRDPMAPKRNLSAYLLYQNAMRDQFKSDNPGMTFGQLSKYTSHMYKSLTPDEKSQWEDRAATDKERYTEEMKHYIPPHGFDQQGCLMAEFAVPRKNSRRNPKDPNMPKRARGSFVLFTKDERPKIQMENPSIKFTDLGAVLGERWRSLVPDDRKRYDELAEQDKIRFAHEMETYRQLNNDTEQVRLQQERQVMQDAFYPTHITHESASQHASSGSSAKSQVMSMSHSQSHHDMYQHQQQAPDHDQQYYLQDQHQPYHSHPAAGDPRDQVYHPHQQHDIFKTEGGLDGHVHHAHGQQQVHEQPPPDQLLYHEDSDIYKTDPDAHSAYYTP